MNGTLIYGYGNPGREDDGLGVAFADRMQEWSDRLELPHLCYDRNYQLNIEDALEVSKYDLVLFADATIEPVDDFLITEVTPSDTVNFTMHAVSPDYIAYLSRTIFDRSPGIFLLHIRGYQWNMQEGLSAKARNSLNRAVAFIQSVMQQEGPLELHLRQAVHRNRVETKS
jgi:hydrogenase maturation protease